MNIAVHPAHRGRNLIKTLTENVIAQSAECGHAGVVGVANQNSVAAFEHKLGFENIAGLDAFIEWLPHRLDAERALADAEFAHRWSDATLSWRMANPANPLRIVASDAHSLTVEGASSMALLRARALMPRGEVTLSAGREALPRPAVVIGLAPRGCRRTRGAIDIPRRLRPSPLRLIYFAHEERHRRFDAGRMLFSFLDFDAF